MTWPRLDLEAPSSWYCLGLSGCCLDCNHREDDCLLQTIRQEASVQKWLCRNQRRSNTHDLWFTAFYEHDSSLRRRLWWYNPQWQQQKNHWEDRQSSVSFCLGHRPPGELTVGSIRLRSPRTRRTLVHSRVKWNCAELMFRFWCWVFTPKALNACPISPQPNPTNQTSCSCCGSELGSITTRDSSLARLN